MNLSIWWKCLLTKNIHTVCFFPNEVRTEAETEVSFIAPAPRSYFCPRQILILRMLYFVFCLRYVPKSSPSLAWPPDAALSAKILPLPKIFLICLCVICILEAVPWFGFLYPTRQFWLHLSFWWDEALLSHKKVSATTGLQAQVLLRVMFSQNQQGLLIYIGGQFELLTYLHWQKFNFQAYCPFLSSPILSPFDLTHLPSSFLMSFLQNQPLSAHPTPCKQPGALERALEALAQPLYLPPGHPWSSLPPHWPSLTPLLPPFTQFPAPHLCREVYLLYIVLVFISNPSVNRLPPCRAQCSVLNTFSPRMKPY